MRILLVRTSALGDIVHTLPVLHALRRAMPEATLGWVVEKVFSPLVDGHPDLDAVFPVRLRAWRRKTLSRPVRREIFAALGAIRRFRPDVAIDLMGNHKGALLARLSGAERVVGAARGDRREPSSALWVGERVELRGVHAVDRALSHLRAFDLDVHAADFASDKLFREIPEAARTFLDSQQRPYVLIQPGAGWGNKTYPPSGWGEVARRLVETADVEVLVPIAPGEEHLAAAVVEASGGAARAVDAGPFDVLAAILRHARLLLGGDTGPLHLAHALGTPVLAVLGPTDPARHGPYGEPENVLVERLPCSFCYKRFAEPKACLLAISPAAIAERARRILAR